jgi:hypothetical protein
VSGRGVGVGDGVAVGVEVGAIVTVRVGEGVAVPWLAIPVASGGTTGVAPGTAAVGIKVAGSSR